MKRNAIPGRNFCAFVFAVFATCLNSTAWGDFTWEAVPPGYGLAWSDEFNGAAGSAPNATNWSYETGATGWGNNELQNYTTNIANAQIINDPNAADSRSLGIIAIDTNPGNGAYGTVGRYTSARLNTAGKRTLQYGYMVARARMARGQGIWPAYWMLGTNFPTVGWPACGEIDIMENFGKTSELPLNHGSLHDGIDFTNIWSSPTAPLAAEYHTFSALWVANRIDFFVDGNLYFTVTSANQTTGTWQFNHAFYHLLNLAVGGGALGGTLPGNPDATTSFPQTMLVDYVRTYQTGLATPTPVVSSTWRVNAGGDTYTDTEGNVWAADTNFSGGWSASGNPPTGGTNDPTLFQYQRFGFGPNNATVPFTYTFNVPTGTTYQVDLKFMENYFTAAGLRQFNVVINGTTVLTNFDVFTAAGGQFKAIDRYFNNITPTAGGQIVIAFNIGAADRPEVNALQIIPQSMAGTSTPTPTRTNTPTNTPTRTLTPIPTATATATATRTQTSSPTGTSTSTRTWTTLPTSTFTTAFTGTFTPTRTSTSTATATASFTSTAMATATSTATRTATPIPTASTTPTSSATLTVSPSPTRTPTATSTTVFTATSTPTTGSTNTFTATRTATPTSTASTTPTSSATLTASPSASPTRTQTATRTMTSTPLNTSTVTTTPIFSFTVTSTPVNSATASPTRTSTSTVTGIPTNTATLVNTATATSTRTNTPVNSPTSTSTVTAVNTVTATSTSTGVFTATATATSTRTSTPVFSFTVTSTGTATSTPVSTSTFTGTMTSTSTSVATATASPTRTNTPVPTLTSTATSTSTSSSTATLTASSTSTATNASTATPSNTPTDTPTSTPTFTSSWTFTSTFTPTFTSTSTPTRTLTSTSTPTNTFTPTATFTSTVTPTSTPFPGTKICDPDPNPAQNETPISICVEVPGPSTVAWSVYTTAFRMITQGTQPVLDRCVIQWDLKDKTGAQVANGLYYFRVDVKGPQPASKIAKVMVLR